MQPLVSAPPTEELLLLLGQEGLLQAQEPLGAVGVPDAAQSPVRVPEGLVGPVVRSTPAVEPTA